MFSLGVENEQAGNARRPPNLSQEPKFSYANKDIGKNQFSFFI